MADIHPQLISDCVYLGRFTLCHLLLSNDSNYPWFILVPDRDGVREIYQLSDSDKSLLMAESCAFSAFLDRHYSPDKLNVAALGNQVPQLHLHHIARFKNDPAWPTPIWGKVPVVPYGGEELESLRKNIDSANLDAFTPADEFPQI
ncbi:MAG: HIT family protein [Pseudomonadota bacterium]